MVIRLKVRDGGVALGCAQRLERWLEPRPPLSRKSRILLLVLATLFLGGTVTQDIEALPARSARIPYRTDARVERLTRFFELYHCPAPRHVQEYLLAADRYGLDYRLLPAISVRETSCGLTQWRNNYWGYHPGRQPFQTVDQGIDFVARQLGEGIPYKGKNLEQKLFTYNPLTAYPGEVKSIMLQIDR